MHNEIWREIVPTGLRDRVLYAHTFATELELVHQESPAASHRQDLLITVARAADLDALIDSH